MKFLSKYTDNTLRFFIIILTLYALIFAGIPIFNSIFTKRLTFDDCSKIESVDINGNVHVEISRLFPNGVGEKSGLKVGDKILAVNGIPVNSMNEFLNIIVKVDTHVPALYTIERQTEIKSIVVPVYKYFHLIFYIFAFLGLGFLMNGFFVGISKPKELTSQIFFLFGFFSSVGFMIYGGVWYYVGYSGTLMIHYYMANIFVYPLLFHFFTIYPVFVNFKKRKLIIFFVYLYSLILSFPLLLSEQSELFLDKSPVVSILVSYSPLLIIIAAFSIFVKSYLKIRNPERKEPLRVLLIGLIIGLAGFAYYYFVFSLFVINLGMSPLYRLPAIMVLAIPITFGYSIYKFRILDTEFFVKRGIVFTLAALVTIVAYLFAIDMLETIFEYYKFSNKQLITVITVILVIFSFSYITKLIKSFVDKRFYKTRYNYRKSLLNFSNELPYLNNMDEVAVKLKNTLSETMGVKKVEFLEIKGKYCVSDNPEDKLINDLCFYLFENDKNPKLLFDINMAENSIPHEYAEYIKKENIVLALPVLVKDELIASINLGEKPEGSPYTDEDIDLLKTICSNISVVYENSRLRLEEIRKNKIEEELKVAKNIQEGLLPDRDYKCEHLEISCASSPARIIGGDFFDIICLDKDNILIVIADVSGKGLPAALYMAKVQALIRFAAKIFKTPREIIIEVNKQIFGKFERNAFVTVSLGMFNIKERKLKYVRAGHNPAIFARNGSVELLNTRGIGLGLDKDHLFSKHLDEHELKLESNSIVLFYTDGLNEAMNRNKEEFGMERLINLIRQNKHLSPSDINRKLESNVKSFVKDAEQHDDITFVVVKTY
ncbi:MAG: SpoIIE family protein phosphatase [Ignavibacteria bacterium]